MTVEEAAQLLFVSRRHVCRLLEQGVLFETLPKRPFENIDIDVASVEAYVVRQKMAQDAYLAGDQEDFD